MKRRRGRDLLLLRVSFAYPEGSKECPRVHDAVANCYTHKLVAGELLAFIWLKWRPLRVKNRACVYYM